MSNFKKVLIIGTAALLLFGSYAAASQVTTYTFDGGTGTKTASSTASGVTASIFDDSTGVANFANGNPAAGKSIQAKNWKTGNYFTYTLTPTAGYRLSMSSLQFDDEKDSSLSSTWQLSYKVGNGSFNNAVSGTVHSSFGSNNNSLSGISGLQNATNALTFHLSATNGSNDTKNWRLDNVVLNGETQAMASLSTAVTTVPSAKVLTGTSGVQYVLTTTNDALSGGTIAADTLNYALGFSSQSGLSFATNNGSGIARNGSNSNIINVNTSTSGTKGGTVNVSSSNSWRQNMPSTLSSVDVYQAASLTVTDGSAINIANANTSDGGQRAAARLKTMAKTGGDSAINITGLTAGGHGSESVISQNSNTSGTAAVSGNVLNGTYSATYQLGFEHDDQSIVGTSSGDIGTFIKSISKTIADKAGDQSVMLGAGRQLSGLWAKSDKAVGSKAYLMEGVLSTERTISTSWRNAIPGEGYHGQNLASDVLTLSGIDNELFVLQMAYDESLLSFSEGQVFPKVCGLEDGKWDNAALGNANGMSNFVGNVAYNSQYFALGNFGVDTVNNVAWVVVDHGGSFAIPEPATVVLLLAGGMLAQIRRRKI